jgi:hypothetical protein
MVVLGEGCARRQLRVELRAAESQPRCALYHCRLRCRWGSADMLDESVAGLAQQPCFLGALVQFRQHTWAAVWSYLAGFSGFLSTGNTLADPERQAT